QVGCVSIVWYPVVDTSVFECFSSEELNQPTPPLERQNETPPTHNNRSLGFGGVWDCSANN
ncbi:uncharacterized protein METZ01_LOCUS516145, partial [marine metagenome]